MGKWLVTRLKEYETTFAGILLGAGAGAAMSIKSGQITKTALITGASIGACGALMKTPTWARIFNNRQDETSSSTERSNQ
jgi:hypothetical protein